MAIKLLVTGDMHLGKRSANIPENVEESPTIYTWNKIVDWSIQNEIDAVLLTGDIIDQDNKFFETIGPIQKGFKKLAENRIKVFVVAGNHDYDVLPQIIANNEFDNVVLLGSNGSWESKNFTSNGLTINIFGWSFPKQFVTDNPLRNFDEEILDLNQLNIGMVHGEVNSSDSRYGPLNLDDLVSYQAVKIWVLGHIHKEQKINDDPLVYYPGSPQALSSKEVGEHGALLLNIKDNEDFNVEQISLSPVKYEKLAIDLTSVDVKDDLRGEVTAEVINEAKSNITNLENVSYLVYDIILKGRKSNIREIMSRTEPIIEEFDYGLESGTTILVRKIINELTPAIDNMDELAKQPTPAGILAKTILAIQNNNSNDFLDNLLEKWALELKRINSSATYQPIIERVRNKSSETAKENILEECNKLLDELIKQNG